MKTIIGVRFRNAGRIYSFDPGENETRRGTHVIVETSRGMEYGTVVVPPHTVEDEEAPGGLKAIKRIATQKDTEQEQENRAREREALPIAKQRIRAHGLDMKLVEVEYTFDRSKILFYFTADGRVDFRELVKDLASYFHTRIELRQIGVRDATKLIGGIGSCGRVLCCHSYMSDFVPVSIKMAKEQNLSLNPGKISGMCGRLMCCLQYEADTYHHLNKGLPRTGDYATTPNGVEGRVQSVDVLRQRVKVVVEVGDDKEVEEYAAEELQFRRKGKQEKAAQDKSQEKGGREKGGEGRGKRRERDTTAAMAGEDTRSQDGDAVTAEESAPQAAPEQEGDREGKPRSQRNRRNRRSRNRHRSEGEGGEPSGGTGGARRTEGAAAEAGGGKRSKSADAGVSDGGAGDGAAGGGAD